MANDNKFRFTKSNVEKLQPTDKRAYYYDTAEPSLMLQVTPNGVKTYYVYKRILSDTVAKKNKPSFLTAMMTYYD